MIDLHPGVEHDVDPRHPRLSCVHAHWFGSAYTTQADRDIAEQIARLAPDIVDEVRAEHHLAQRVVRAATGAAGITQVLAFGVGIPAAGGVHHSVAAGRTGTRVVYLDPDPVTGHVVDQITAACPRVHAVRAELRLMTPATVFDQLRRHRLFDARQPAAVLALGGQWLPVSPRAFIAAVRTRVAPGSRILLTHATAPAASDTAAGRRHWEALACYQRAGAQPTARTVAELAYQLDGITAPGPDRVRVIVSTDNAHPHGDGQPAYRSSRELCGAGAAP